MKKNNFQQFYKSFSKGFIMLAAILCFSSFNVNANNKPFSKQDLFEAIYFLEGDIVANVPFLVKVKGKISTTTSTNRQAIIQEVNKMYPGFINQLYEDVLSDDHHSISMTLKIGAQLTLLAEAKLKADKSEGFPNMDQFDLTDSAERSIALNELLTYYENKNTDNPNPDLGVMLPYGQLPVLRVVIRDVVIDGEILSEGSNGSTELHKTLATNESLSTESLVSQLVSLF